MKLYLAGPMSGLPDFNYPAFRVARVELEAAGYEVLSPLDNDPDPATTGQRSWEWYLRASIRQVTEAEAVAVLPGWVGSRGAKLEVHVARSLSMEVQLVPWWVRRAELATLMEVAR